MAFLSEKASSMYKDTANRILLGRGGYGAVKEFDNTAVKYFNGSDKDGNVNSDLAVVQALGEIQYYSSLRHPNIIKLIGWSYSKTAEFGDAKDSPMILIFPRGIKIKDALNQKLTTLRQIAADVLSALVFLADHGVAHCDLKPDNIIWMPPDDEYSGFPGRTILIDFGIAKMATYATYSKNIPVKLLFKDKEYMMTNVAYSGDYKDPEYFPEMYNSIRCELYAYGMLIKNLEILRGEAFSPDPILGELSNKCLVPLKDRQTAKEILNWYQSVTDQEYISGFEMCAWEPKYLSKIRPPYNRYNFHRFHWSELGVGVNNLQVRAMAVDLMNRTITKVSKSEVVWTERHTTAVNNIASLISLDAVPEGYSKEMVDIAIINDGILAHHTFWDRMRDVPGYGSQLDSALMISAPRYIPEYLLTPSFGYPFNKLVDSDISVTEIPAPGHAYPIENVELYPTLVEPISIRVIDAYATAMQNNIDNTGNLLATDITILTGLQQRILQRIKLTGKKLEYIQALDDVYKIVTNYKNSQVKILGRTYTHPEIKREIFGR